MAYPYGQEGWWNGNREETPDWFKYSSQHYDIEEDLKKIRNDDEDSRDCWIEKEANDDNGSSRGRSHRTSRDRDGNVRQHSGDGSSSKDRTGRHHDRHNRDKRGHKQDNRDRRKERSHNRDNNYRGKEQDDWNNENYTYNDNENTAESSYDHRSDRDRRRGGTGHNWNVRNDQSDEYGRSRDNDDWNNENFDHNDNDEIIQRNNDENFSIRSDRSHQKGRAKYRVDGKYVDDQEIGIDQGRNENFQYNDNDEIIQRNNDENVSIRSDRSNNRGRAKYRVDGKYVDDQEVNDNQDWNENDENFDHSEKDEIIQRNDDENISIRSDRRYKKGRANYRIDGIFINNQEADDDRGGNQDNWKNDNDEIIERSRDENIDQWSDRRHKREETNYRSDGRYVDNQGNDLNDRRIDMEERTEEIYGQIDRLPDGDNIDDRNESRHDQNPNKNYGRNRKDRRFAHDGRNNDHHDRNQNKNYKYGRNNQDGRNERIDHRDNYNTIERENEDDSNSIELYYDEDPTEIIEEEILEVGDADYTRDIKRNRGQALHTREDRLGGRHYDGRKDRQSGHHGDGNSVEVYYDDTNTGYNENAEDMEYCGDDVGIDHENERNKRYGRDNGTNRRFEGDGRKDRKFDGDKKNERRFDGNGKTDKIIEKDDRKGKNNMGFNTDKKRNFRQNDREKYQHDDRKARGHDDNDENDKHFMKEVGRERGRRHNKDQQEGWGDSGEVRDRHNWSQDLDNLSDYQDNDARKNSKRDDDGARIKRLERAVERESQNRDLNQSSRRSKQRSDGAQRQNDRTSRSPVRSREHSQEVRIVRRVKTASPRNDRFSKTPKKDDHTTSELNRGRRNKKERSDSSIQKEGKFPRKHNHSNSPTRSESNEHHVRSSYRENRSRSHSQQRGGYKSDDRKRQPESSERHSSHAKRSTSKDKNVDDEEDEIIQKTPDQPVVKDPSSQLLLPTMNMVKTVGLGSGTAIWEISGPAPQTKNILPQDGGQFMNTAVTPVATPNPLGIPSFQKPQDFTNTMPIISAVQNTGTSSIVEGQVPIASNNTQYRISRWGPGPLKDVQVPCSSQCNVQDQGNLPQALLQGPGNQLQIPNVSQRPVQGSSYQPQMSTQVQGNQSQMSVPVQRNQPQMSAIPYTGTPSSIQGQPQRGNLVVPQIQATSNMSNIQIQNPVQMSNMHQQHVIPNTPNTAIQHHHQPFQPRPIQTSASSIQYRPTTPNFTQRWHPQTSRQGIQSKTFPIVSSNLIPVQSRNPLIQILQHKHVTSFQQVPTQKPVTSFQQVPTQKPVTSFQQVPTQKPVTSFQQVPTQKPVTSFQQVPTQKPVTFQAPAVHYKIPLKTNNNAKVQQSGKSGLVQGPKKVLAPNENKTQMNKQRNKAADDKQRNTIADNKRRKTVADDKQRNTVADVKQRNKSTDDKQSKNACTDKSGKKAMNEVTVIEIHDDETDNQNTGMTLRPRIRWTGTMKHVDKPVPVNTKLSIEEDALDSVLETKKSSTSVQRTKVDKEKKMNAQNESTKIPSAVGDTKSTEDRKTETQKTNLIEKTVPVANENTIKTQKQTAENSIENKPVSHSGKGLSAGRTTDDGKKAPPLSKEKLKELSKEKFKELSKTTADPLFENTIPLVQQKDEFQKSSNEKNTSSGLNQSTKVKESIKEAQNQSIGTSPESSRPLPTVKTPASVSKDCKKATQSQNTGLSKQLTNQTPASKPPLQKKKDLTDTKISESVGQEAIQSSKNLPEKQNVKKQAPEKSTNCQADSKDSDIEPVDSSIPGLTLITPGTETNIQNVERGRFSFQNEDMSEKMPTSQQIVVSTSEELSFDCQGRLIGTRTKILPVQVSTLGVKHIMKWQDRSEAYLKKLPVVPRDSVPFLCPIPECQVKKPSLKRHSYSAHIPSIFKEDKWFKNEKRCGEALEQLSVWIFGSKGKESELVTLINGSELLPKSCFVRDVDFENMRKFCRYHKWAEYKEYTLHPMNSPVCLIHWKAITIALLFLNATRRKLFKQMFNNPSWNIPYQSSKVQETCQSQGEDNSTNIIKGGNPLIQDSIETPSTDTSFKGNTSKFKDISKSSKAGIDRRNESRRGKESPQEKTTSVETKFVDSNQVKSKNVDTQPGQTKQTKSATEKHGPETGNSRKCIAHQESLVPDPEMKELEKSKIARAKQASLGAEAYGKDIERSEISQRKQPISKDLDRSKSNKEQQLRPITDSDSKEVESFRKSYEASGRGSSRYPVIETKQNSNRSIDNSAAQSSIQKPLEVGNSLRESNRSISDEYTGKLQYGYYGDTGANKVRETQLGTHQDSSVKDTEKPEKQVFEYGHLRTKPLTEYSNVRDFSTNLRQSEHLVNDYRSSRPDFMSLDDFKSYKNFADESWNSKRYPSKFVSDEFRNSPNNNDRLKVSDSWQSRDDINFRSSTKYFGSLSQDLRSSKETVDDLRLDAFRYPEKDSYLGTYAKDIVSTARFDDGENRKCFGLTGFGDQMKGSTETGYLNTNQLREKNSGQQSYDFKTSRFRALFPRKTSQTEDTNSMLHFEKDYVKADLDGYEYTKTPRIQNVVGNINKGSESTDRYDYRKSARIQDALGIINKGSESVNKRPFGDKYEYGDAPRDLSYSDSYYTYPDKEDAPHMELSAALEKWSNELSQDLEGSKKSSGISPSGSFSTKSDKLDIKDLYDYKKTESSYPTDLDNCRDEYMSYLDENQSNDFHGNASWEEQPQSKEYKRGSLKDFDQENMYDKCGKTWQHSPAKKAKMTSTFTGTPQQTKINKNPSADSLAHIWKLLNPSNSSEQVDNYNKFITGVYEAKVPGCNFKVDNENSEIDNSLDLMWKVKQEREATKRPKTLSDMWEAVKSVSKPKIPSDQSKKFLTVGELLLFKDETTKGKWKVWSEKDFSSTPKSKTSLPGAPPGYGPPQGQPGYGPPGGQPGYGPPGGYGPPPPQSGFGPPAGGYGGGPPPGIDPNVYQWFMTVDQDKSGHITAHELQQALVNGNWSHFNPETCRLMINMFDKDHTGTIQMHEFQALWNYIQQWKGVFERFDGNRSGSIEQHELQQAYQQMGYNLSPQFCSTVIAKFDVYGRSSLTLDNFIQSCVMLKSLTDSFKQRDPQMQGNIRMSYEDFMTTAVFNKI